jgi:hypothetical protein
MIRCTLHGSGNHSLSPRAPTIVKQVFRRLQVPGNENPCHDCQYSLSAFVHRDMICFRLLFVHGMNYSLQLEGLPKEGKMF